MNIEKYTLRSQEALQRAQQIAAEWSHQEVGPEHLFLALLEQTDGVVPALGLASLRTQMESELKRLPGVTGARG